MRDDVATRHDWRKWRRYFAGRRNRRSLPDPFLKDERLDAIPASVARSLAIFQLGESGGGTVIEQVRRSRIGSIDSDYVDAMQMFVAEERFHAELLACAVRMLGGELIRKNWTARLFVFGRRLVGLRTKITVLLAAEVVGICYYHILASRMPAGPVRDLLESIVEDEVAHLDFHCAFLRTQTNGLVRSILFRSAWRLVSHAASIVVMVDHRRALKDMGISRREVWNRWQRVSRQAEALATCGHADRGSCDSATSVMRSKAG